MLWPRPPAQAPEHQSDVPKRAAAVCEGAGGGGGGGGVSKSSMNVHGFGGSRLGPGADRAGFSVPAVPSDDDDEPAERSKRRGCWWCLVRAWHLLTLRYWLASRKRRPACLWKALPVALGLLQAFVLLVFGALILPPFLHHTLFGPVSSPRFFSHLLYCSRTFTTYSLYNIRMHVRILFVKVGIFLLLPLPLWYLGMLLLLSVVLLRSPVPPKPNKKDRDSATHDMDIRGVHTYCKRCLRKQYASSLFSTCLSRKSKAGDGDACAQGAVHEALRGVRAMCARPRMPQPRAARLCARAVVRMLLLAGGHVRESEPAARRVPVAARVRGARRTTARHAACARCALLYASEFYASQRVALDVLVFTQLLALCLYST